MLPTSRPASPLPKSTSGSSPGKSFSPVFVTAQQSQQSKPRPLKTRQQRRALIQDQWNTYPGRVVNRILLSKAARSNYKKMTGHAAFMRYLRKHITDDQGTERCVVGGRLVKKINRKDEVKKGGNLKQRKKDEDAEERDRWAVFSKHSAQKRKEWLARMEARYGGVSTGHEQKLRTEQEEEARFEGLVPRMDGTNTNLQKEQDKFKVVKDLIRRFNPREKGKDEKGEYELEVLSLQKTRRPEPKSTAPDTNGEAERSPPSTPYTCVYTTLRKTGPAPHQQAELPSTHPAQPQTDDNRIRRECSERLDRAGDAAGRVIRARILQRRAREQHLELLERGQEDGLRNQEHANGLLRSVSSPNITTPSPPSAPPLQGLRPLQQSYSQSQPQQQPRSYYPERCHRRARHDTILRAPSPPPAALIPKRTRTVPYTESGVPRNPGVGLDAGARGCVVEREGSREGRVDREKGGGRRVRFA